MKIGEPGIPQKMIRDLNLIFSLSIWNYTWNEDEELLIRGISLELPPTSSFSRSSILSTIQENSI
jgi:hypothetical protein